MDLEFIVKICLLYVVHCGVVHSVDKVYLTSSCTTLTATVSGSRTIESSTSLGYANNMNCTYTVTSTSARYKIKAIFRLFHLEEKMSGSCVDYINVHDGGSASATRLNSEPLCGATVPSDLLSTGSQLTLTFSTDGSGTGRGFDILFSEYATAPCQSDEFLCTIGICIKSDLKCNNYDECGDNSDEASCTLDSLLGVGAADNSALIAGLTIGLSALVIFGVLLGVYIYRQYRWRQFLKDPMPKLKTWETVDNYPVTNKYYKDGFKNIGYRSVSSSEVFKDFEDDDDLEKEEPIKKSRPVSPATSVSGISTSKGKIPLGLKPGSSKA